MWNTFTHKTPGHSLARVCVFITRELKRGASLPFSPLLLLLRFLSCWFTIFSLSHSLYSQIRSKKAGRVHFFISHPPFLLSRAACILFGCTTGLTNCLRVCVYLVTCTESTKRKRESERQQWTQLLQLSSLCELDKQTSALISCIFFSSLSLSLPLDTRLHSLFALPRLNIASILFLFLSLVYSSCAWSLINGGECESASENKWNLWERKKNSPSLCVSSLGQTHTPCSPL